jgi:hypothetical protein
MIHLPYQLITQYVAAQVILMGALISVVVWLAQRSIKHPIA